MGGKHYYFIAFLESSQEDDLEKETYGFRLSPLLPQPPPLIKIIIIIIIITTMMIIITIYL